MRRRDLLILAVILVLFAGFVARGLNERKDSQLQACKRGLIVRDQINDVARSLKALELAAAKVRIESAQKTTDAEQAKVDRRAAGLYVKLAGEVRIVAPPDCEQVVN